MQLCFHSNATNRQQAMNHWQTPETATALPLGAHLVTPRSGYEHHGIHVGAGRVVHYSGWSRKLLRGPLVETSLADFAGGRTVDVKVNPGARYAPEDIVTRARSRLGENNYRFASNNCEHFSTWCVSGESRSEQVERMRARLRAPSRALAGWLARFVGTHAAPTASIAA